MTPQEKDLIQGVFDRLARAGSAGRDGEAASYIEAQLRQQPDAAYGLVQAVVMLEAGMTQAQARISDLQRQLEPSPATGGSFLNTASPWGGASVPRSGGPVYAAPASPPAYAPAPLAAPAISPWTQPGGGGFLRNAATMAAGVAGGTLIAEGLSSLFGGHNYGGGFGGGIGGGYGGPRDVVEEQVTVNNYYDSQSGAAGGGTQDASYDSSGDAGFDSGYDDSADI